MKTEFESGLGRGMAIAGLVVIPPGLVLSGVLGGWRGLAGAFVGFGVASLHSVVVISILKWALTRPPQSLPSILMMSYFGRLVALAGILFGLHYIKALNIIALLSCFLALYVSHSMVEIGYAWKSFGAVLRSKDKGD